MSTRQPPSLASRQADLTQRIIVDAAIELLEATSVNELSVRAIAKHSGVSERTMFRYFSTRDELLDTVAMEVARRLEIPAEPTSLQELLAYPGMIYPRFEAKTALTKAALHSELFSRIRSMNTRVRGSAVRRLIDELAPDRSEHERRLATANIFYQSVAATWHYYRYYVSLSLEDSIECATQVITQALAGLGVRGGQRGKRKPQAAAAAKRKQ